MAFRFLIASATGTVNPGIVMGFSGVAGVLSGLIDGVSDWFKGNKEKTRKPRDPNDLGEDNPLRPGPQGQIL